jgi:hypothetical protein
MTREQIASVLYALLILDSVALLLIGKPLPASGVGMIRRLGGFE